MTVVPSALIRVNRVANVLYDRGLGWLLGHRILRLTHVGRRSRRRYRTVLEVVGRDPSRSEFFVISGFGACSDWLRNLEAGGTASVEFGRRSFPTDHRELNHAEAYAVVAGYERRHRLITPVVRWALSWLLGWRYHGTEAERRQLVAQLPVVGLRPAGRAGLPANRQLGRDRRGRNGGSASSAQQRPQRDRPAREQRSNR